LVAHEGAPVSAWPEVHQRLVLIIGKDPLAVPPEGWTPPVSPPSAPLSAPPAAATATSPASIGRPPPVDVLGEAIDALDAADNPFTLDISARRAQQIQSGERDFALDRPAGFDVDEPLPFGAPDVSRARAVDRAMDPHNRQLSALT